MLVAGNNNSNWIDALDGVTNATDFIYGFGGNDVIFGLGGDDVIHGGLGADYLDGGAGSDRVNYSDSAVGVTIDLVTGDGYGGTAEGDELVSIEEVSGSSYQDLIVGNGSDNVLLGFDGNDDIKGGGGADTLLGGADHDEIWGEDGADTLFGQTGNDVLKGGGGADTLDGGSGVDTASYAGSSAGVSVSLYDDTANGGDATGDELIDIENLTGSDHNDNLSGNDGANALGGGAGNDLLKGYGGADSLQGHGGNDTLYGMGGNDTMIGGNGDDWMVGGANVDTMTGGAGADTFDFNSVAESTFATPDLITDFNDLDEATTDKIDLSTIDANTTLNGNQAFIWIGNNNEWTTDYGAGQLRFNSGFLEGDLNGDFVADFRIEIDGVPVIHEYALIL